MHLAQKVHDLFAHRVQIGVDFFERARRLVLIEVAVERDFVTDDADLAVLGVALVGGDPGIGHMRLHFLDEVGFVDLIHAAARFERDVLEVAQLAVSLVFDNFLADAKQAVQGRGRIGLLVLVQFLDHLLGGRIFPAHGIADLLLLFGFQGDAGLLARGLERVVVGVEIVRLRGADELL